jgi:hypothetical protein
VKILFTGNVPQMPPVNGLTTSMGLKDEFLEANWS